MKICIPTNDDHGLRGVPADHFGRAPFLTMIDADSRDVKVVRNPGCHQQTHDCHHVPVLQAHRVEAVVCRGMGRRALMGLSASGIGVFVSNERSLDELLAALDAGRLRRLTDSSACGGAHAHDGHRSGSGRCRGHA